MLFYLVCVPYVNNLVSNLCRKEGFNILLFWTWADGWKIIEWPLMVWLGAQIWNWLCNITIMTFFLNYHAYLWLLRVLSRLIYSLDLNINKWSEIKPSTITVPKSFTTLHKSASSIHLRHVILVAAIVIYNHLWETQIHHKLANRIIADYDLSCAFTDYPSVPWYED